MSAGGAGGGAAGAARRRLAGAPISWGVSEVPGWGRRLAPARVLAEMSGAGLGATELGPPGFLPDAPAELRRLLETHGLRLVAGFVAAVLHRPERRREALAAVDAAAGSLAAAGAGVLVVAAAGSRPGYEERETLQGEDWARLVDGVARVRDLAARRGLETAFHPHAGTVVERPDEVARLLELSDVGLCLDTGHLALGGADPVRVVEEAAGRVRHAHLKDVDLRLAARLRRRELGYRDAVAAGLYRPLGGGDLDFPRLLDRLEGAGYRGWYVLEQDLVLGSEPGAAERPIDAVRTSVAYFQHLLGPAGPLEDGARPGRPARPATA